MEIRFGAGVCGVVAAEERTVIVPDVTTFPGHITCDARSRSEIVVPVFDHKRSLLAVLDIDSERPNAFDDVDGRWLERLVAFFERSRQ
jgi:GAF domain-containing protein